MKHINQGFAIAALLSAAQASYASPFPADGEPTSVPVAWTYADRHMDGSDQRMGSAFPANAASTYADLYAGQSEQITAALSED
jgi:hypothetical protein